MKEKLLSIFCVLFVAVNANAQLKPYDFSDGKLFYKITNADAKEVYVVSEKARGKYTTKLEGEINIPEQVVNEDGVEFVVKGIGNQVFYMCEDISGVTFPGTLEKIGDKAFLGCHNIVSLTVPGNVKKIGKWAFMSCARLEDINVDSENASYSSYNGVLYDKDAKKLIQCPCGKAGFYEIPATVEEIGGQAFYGCTKLSEVSIPSSVGKIGNDGFYACTKLRKIVCKIAVPLTGDAMGTEVFEQVSTANIGGSCVLYVPEGCVDAYYEAPQWNMFAPKIEEIISSGMNSNALSTFKAMGGNGEIIITQDANGKQVEIYDIAGGLVGKLKTNNTEFSMPIPRGVYIVRCGNSQAKVSVR